MAVFFGPSFEVSLLYEGIGRGIVSWKGPTNTLGSGGRTGPQGDLPVGPAQTYLLVGGATPPRPVLGGSYPIFTHQVGRSFASPSAGPVAPVHWAGRLPPPPARAGQVGRALKVLLSCSEQFHIVGCVSISMSFLLKQNQGVLHIFIPKEMHIANLQYQARSHAFDRVLVEYPDDGTFVVGLQFLLCKTREISSDAVCASLQSTAAVELLELPSSNTSVRWEIIHEDPETVFSTLHLSRLVSNRAALKSSSSFCLITATRLLNLFC